MEGGGGEAVTVSKQEMEKLVEQMKQFEVRVLIVWLHFAAANWWVWLWPC